MLIVEADDFAARRGAHALATIRGHGIVSDASSMTAPDPTAEGPAAGMREAIGMAGAVPGDIDLICAHGTGTLLNDRTEARALHKVFGRRSAEIPCTSIKSMLGHTLGAAGAMNAVAAVAARRAATCPRRSTSRSRTRATRWPALPRRIPWPRGTCSRTRSASAERTAAS